MANLFWIPKSPIKSWTVRGGVPILPNGIPTFLGYGNQGALSRFKVLLPSLRDTQKHHPARFGNRVGQNTVNRNRMDISKKFVGKYLITGTVLDANGVAVNNCTVKLFANPDNIYLTFGTTNATGAFSISFAFDSKYPDYFLVPYLASTPALSGVVINNITARQV